MGSNVDIFFSNHLSEAITASSLTIPSSTPTLSNVNATVVITSVAATDIQNAFYFETDTDIATNGTDDVKYYVDSSNWSNMSTELDADSGTISQANGAFVASDTISQDFIRHTANDLFGTHFGVDVFNNETTVRTALQTSTATLATNIKSTIDAVGVSGDHDDLQGSAGAKYLDDSVTSTANVTRELINQLLTQSNSVGRFSNLDNYQYVSGTDGKYKVPVIAGDSISYSVTISPNSNQDTDVSTGGTSTARKYRVKLVLQ